MHDNLIEISATIKCSKFMLMKVFCSIHDPTGVTLLTRLWLKFSHLNEHKFRHNFKDSVVPIWDCRTETQTT